ncbi:MULTISPECIES: DUF2189 domain-containing protein [Chromobacterium]|uniref:DUF2189 domain-containing protein n=1 Tax=Chromobacterium aquaticum TaxID=467180 RepID=A0ABV8ZN83_9NEIS|nr:MULTISPECIES: DUF2189 domain-containing protein [Chromobacterium]KMN35910.1 membrane protein [Chromobacterium sp. LK1]MCD5362961.1 DUF2189 domain-containing protein [Chromobacterium aquaticum]
MDVTHDIPRDRPVARKVETLRPLQWLKKGFRDFQKAPADCLFYGAVFVLMGYLLTLYSEHSPELIITFATIFLLAGPFLAIGLYDIAKQMEAFDGHGRVKLAHSMSAWRVNLPAFTLYAALLAVLVFGWFRVSLLMFALFYDTAALPSLNDIVVNAFNPDNIVFLVAYFAVGFLFAQVVFSVSVVSIPLMLDKEVDTVTAMIASVQAVLKNVLTMGIWAAIIVALSAVGFVTYFLGLIIIMPVLALASWHAYRDLITFER